MPSSGQRARERGGPGANTTRPGPGNITQSGPQISDAGYDGPSDNRGRSPSNTGQSQATRTASRARSSSRGPAAGQPAQQTDPARDPPKREPRTFSSTLDLGGNAYNILQGTGYAPTELMERPGFGKLGKPATIEINSFPVTAYPTKTVFQYDVLIGSGKELRGLIMAVMESKAIADVVGQDFIFDGRALGWSQQDYGNEKRILVNLDTERGRAPRVKDGKVIEDITRVIIKKATTINLSVLDAYLERRGQKFDNDVLQCINFMDHLLRETPKKVHINLRRSYFARAPDRNDTFDVGQGVEAMKGVYQSLRLTEGKKVVVNVDVSNSCFWHQTNFGQLAYYLHGDGDRNRFLAASQPFKGKEPPLWQTLKRLIRNKFTVKHGKQNEGADTRIWTVKGISPYTAKTYKFNVTSKDDGKEALMTLFDYYLKKYDYRITNWQLPLIESNKPGILFPMDICQMCIGQRYPYKLNENQTASMIKFAVSRPPARRAGIEHGLNMLDWEQDPMLKRYGLKIHRKMLETKARVLDPPEVLYAKNNTAKPAYSGRWDLRGKIFFKPNEAPLKSWSVLILGSTQDKRPPVTPDQVNAFVKSFIDKYREHGGIVENKAPPVVRGIPDVAEAITAAFNAGGNQAQLRPQMMLVILPNKNAEVYQRVKKSLDCRYGVYSQCVQASNVAKNQGQYISNVLMKFNCKLGGTTCTVKTAKPIFSPTTMIIGADVSHPAPGANNASMAALCVSMDQTASRYAAGVQTNGYRVEMIQTEVINSTLKPLIQHWMTTVGQGRFPKHIYYFRDGVSEGQYGPLLKREVKDMQALFKNLADGKEEFVPKFTVVVCEKRHHIRFFPKGGGTATDKNMNPVPGVIVDRDITHTYENDIYLCSHAAIQGTARPTHYHMLMDEARIPVDQFQHLLYQHCYQYQRATTPVSLFPAVYYAHLAAARAIAHIDKSEMDKYFERKIQKATGKAPTDEKDSQAAVPPLLLMDNKNKIRYGMWYI